VTNQGAASSAPTGPVGSEDSDFEIPYKQKARAVRMEQRGLFFLRFGRCVPRVS
jgi:hypothetical protein